MRNDPRSELSRRARRARIVIKIGSGVLTDAHGRLSHRTVRRLASEIAPLAGPKRWPYVVSSGAIAVGVGVLGLKSRPKEMPGLQAAAAVGQGKLVEAWSAGFRKHELHAAQVLLTHSDLADRRRYLNARRALGELERRKAIAVINENDTVSFEEIAFGDNDGLAAQVSNLVDADVLVLMSVAPGLLRADGTAVDVAVAGDPALDELIRPDRSTTGVGGMQTKLHAARVATARGAYVAIVDGRRPGALAELLDGRPVGTLLVPKESDGPMKSRAHWIAHTLRPLGTIAIDTGAAAALRLGGKSLLPSGIVAVNGDFADGDPIEIVHEAHGHTDRIARGLSRYTAAQLREIAGLPSHAIRDRLGFSYGDAAVHRDDLAILSRSEPDLSQPDPVETC